MFQLYITLAYVIPVIYIYFRLNFLIVSRRFRIWYSILFLGIALIFPVLRFSHGEDGVIRNMFHVISGYLVPFFLYLFLSVLVYDLFLLLNLALKLVKKEIRKSLRYRLYLFAAMMILPTLIVIAGAINLNTIRVSEYTIEVPRKSSSITSLKIAFVADFHIDRNTRLAYVNQYAGKIKAINPDILLYGGDIVEGRWDSKINSGIASELKSIQTPYGEFGVLGNHEFYGSQHPGIFYKTTGIRLLNDTIIRINNAFYLAGRYDQIVQERKTAGDIIGKLAGLPLIMIDHRPTQFDEISKTNTDIHLSGHTHNGQMFPINLIIRSMYELSWGYKKKGNTHFFVTSGLRLWGPPVKTAGKSEIMVINVILR